MTRIVEVDARRLLCPMPVIRLQDMINKQTSGTQVRIVCTDPGVLHDIPAWTRLHGHQLVSTVEKEDQFVLIVEKS